MQPERTRAGSAPRRSLRDEDTQARAHRAFAGNLSLRTKLLLLTLIPLVPLALLNAVGLLYLNHLHSHDLTLRLDRAEELWRARVGELTALAERSARSLASGKQVEQALLRNHWGRARESLSRVVLADPDLRGLLVDSDGRILADSGSTRFDMLVKDRALVASALEGNEGSGIELLDSASFWGITIPVLVGGGVEGVVWLGFALDHSFLQGFAEQTRVVVMLPDPLSGELITTQASAPKLPDPPASFSITAMQGKRRFRLRPIELALSGAGGPILSYVGIDHTDLARALRSQLLTLGTTFVLLLVVILVLTLAISNRVVQALGFVVQKMRLLQGGEYQKIDPVVGRDEIAFLGHGFNDMITGLIERDFVRETFGRYMSAEVARAVLDSPEGLRMGGEARVVTILLCDLRGFTSFSAVRRPEEVVRVLNIWLEQMAEVIDDHSGTINEFLGDAILALFGAPVHREDDAIRAVACAVAMQRAMDGVNQRLGSEGIPPLCMGIGLATGMVVAGNIGSEKRVKYGVVGQPVNLASRVESLTVGDDLLIDQITLDACGDNVFTGPSRQVRVKGSDEPLVVHPVLGVGPPFGLRLPSADAPQETRTPLPEGVKVLVWRIHGKEVDSESLESAALSLGEHSLEILSSRPLMPWSDIKLQVRAEERISSESIYGKVVEAGSADEGYRALIRLTRVSPEDRDLLLALRS